MTTLNEAREAIYDLFVAAWGVTTPIQRDGEYFDEPTDNTAWVRISLRSTFREQTSIGEVGNRRHESDANFFVQIFTPKDKGMSEADTLFRLAQTTLEGVTLSGPVHLLATEPQEGGAEDKWNVMVAQTGVQFDEVK